MTGWGSTETIRRAPLCRVAALLTLAAGLLCAGGTAAQNINVEAATESESAAPVAVDPAAAGKAVGQPYGANLFRGDFAGRTEGYTNPHYRIQPGDSIEVRTWGAVSLDQTVTVDPQGNIFLPDVGPIPVQNVPHADLNNLVTRRLGTVFNDEVNVYTNLRSSQPVTVFVTGFVNRPGGYAGVPSNSVLYFLDNAGGIDLERGSFRTIDVVRANETIATVDLYAFLQRGELPQIQFRDGDTIVVAPRGVVVHADGDIANSFVFEFSDRPISGRDILPLARPDPSATNVTVIGVRQTIPLARYLTIDEFAAFAVEDGDQVLFESDRREDFIVVRIEGTNLGPSRFVVRRGTRLKDLLDHVAVAPYEADLSAISIRRESVAVRQRESLEESLRRLELAVTGASSQTAEEAQIRASEVALVQDFVARARNVEFKGVVVLADDGEIRDIALEANDVVTIPEQSSTVLVSGEIRVPQALTFVPGDSITDYVNRSGGYTARADIGRPIIVRRTGEVIAGSGRGTEIRPGDEIIVMPEVPSKVLQFASTIAEIMFRVAVTAAIPFRI